MNITDTLIVSFSDTHSGSPVGLMPTGQWQLRSANVSQNKLQKLVWRAFDTHTKEIGKLRKGRRLIVVFNGDATEGDHHNNKQVSTLYLKEQEELFTNAMDVALKNMRFGKKDLLYFVRGTDSHVGESEERIANDLGAVEYGEGHCWPALRLNINGVRVWYAHKIAGVGRGANRGNSLRNRLRDYYFDALKDGIKPPDYIVGGHFHQRLFSPYAYSDHEMRGFLLPSYKAKDDYSFGVAPFGLGDLGLHYIKINADGAHSWGWLSETVEQEKEQRV